MLARVVALKRMPVNDLKAEWKALFGTEVPNNSRSFLELRLAHSGAPHGVCAQSTGVGRDDERNQDRVRAAGDDFG